MKIVVTSKHVELSFNSEDERKDFIRDCGEKAGPGHFAVWDELFIDDEGAVVDYPASAFGKINDWCLVSFNEKKDNEPDRIEKVYIYTGKYDSPFEEMLKKGRVFLYSVNWS